MSHSAIIEKVLGTKAILAPMLTTTDIPFRLICKQFGAGMTTTEMVSANGISRNSSVSYRFAVLDEMERPVAIQILASSADYVSNAIRQLQPLRPTMFDVNAGCPSDRVCEAGCGAELLDNPDALSDIISAAVKASDVPVSVKVRSQGFSAHNSIESIARIVEDCGAAMLTVHARGRQVKYNSPAQWDDIARAKSAVSIPVVGNGDIFSSEDAYRMMEQTGCDAVMIARGSLGTPWIFRDIASGRRSSITDYAPGDSELHAIVSEHMRALIREFGDINALLRMRKHLLWYMRWYKDFESFRKKIFMKDDARYILDVVDAFFEDPGEQFNPASMEFQEVEQRFRKRVLFWTLPANLYPETGVLRNEQ